MRVQRTVHTSAFVVIPNAIAQHPTMSLAARGLLLMLLSLPDGFQINVRDISAMIPGLGKRGAGKALDELEAFGFYVRTTTRDRWGRVRTATAVYDVPQISVTGAPLPVSATAGRPTPGKSGSNPVKNPLKETTPLPTLPERLAAGEDLADITALPEGEGRGESSPEDNPKGSNEQGQAPADDRDDDGPDDDRPKGGKPADTRNDTGAGGAVEADRSIAGVVDLLACMRQRDARMLFSASDAARIAPLVEAWRKRGASDGAIVEAVCAGLPAELRSPVGLVMNRLTRKMPLREPVSAPVTPVGPVLVECDGCGKPARVAGFCAACRTSAQAKVNPIGDDQAHDPALSGAALARRLMAERLHKAA
ncbi:hypothetical protein [Nonomuraea sp. NPDC023979]|uniref:hypothetical protein n=1 Tax=Nonomuraea sp. NPDC023979 TaxID=3154796 RepID=UPI0033E3ACC2